MKKELAIALLALVLMPLSSLSGEDNRSRGAPGATPPSNAISVNPVGLVRGVYDFKYERFLDHRRGLKLGASFSPGVRFLPEDDDRLAVRSYEIGYRWYSEGQPHNSLFVGTGFRYSNSDARVTVRSFTGSKPSHSVGLREFAVDATVGRRLSFRTGLNVTCAVGLRLSRLNFSSHEPGVRSAIDLHPMYRSGARAAPVVKLLIGYLF